MTDQELNEAVARKLGNTCKCECHIRPVSSCVCGISDDPRHPRDYCHSIEAAWEIVRWLVAQHGGDSVVELKIGDSLGTTCRIGDVAQWREAQADTAPRAICLAFLKAP